MLAAEIIVAFGMAYTLFSIALQRKLVKMEKVYEMQEIMKQKTKELMEMSKNNASIEELREKQAELMKLTTESMKGQMKPLLIILPIFFIVYYFLLPLSLPLLGITAKSVIATLFSFKLTYSGLFILTLFISGLIGSFGLTAIDKVRRKRAKAVQETAQA